MEKCENCSRDSKSIYHTGECPKKVLSIPLAPEFMSLDAMIAKKYGKVAVDPAGGSDSTSVDVVEAPLDEPDQ